MQRRNRRVGIEDLWRKADGTPSARDGRGLRWRVRWVDDQGREHTEAHRVKVDANRRQAELTASLHRGDYVDPRSGAQTFQVLADRFMTGRAVKPKTRAGEESLLASRILPRWGTVRIGDIIESDIRAWLADMQTEVSSSRARQAFILYRQILALAVADRALPRSPADGVKAPRAKTTRDAVFLTVGQVHQLADTMTRPTDATLVRFLAFTGLRWGEASALTVGSIDYGRHRVHVRRTYGDVNGRIVEGVPKSHAARWVPFPAGLDAELHQLTDDRGNDADVFQAPDGGILRAGNWGKRVLHAAVAVVNAPAEGETPEQRKARGGFIPEGLRVHDLRHTAASIAIRAGANVKALQRMLGHESAVMTLDVYAGLWDEDLQDLGTAIGSAAYPVRTGDDRDESATDQK